MYISFIMKLLGTTAKHQCVLNALNNVFARHWIRDLKK
jgi:hypothetical protein